MNAPPPNLCFSQIGPAHNPNPQNKKEVDNARASLVRAEAELKAQAA